MHNAFVSVEPLLSEISSYGWLYSAISNHTVKWIIIGAETGNREDKVIPERRWITDIVQACQKSGIPVFMKSSLSPIWQEPLIQEFPW
jgi:protein gp37